MDDVSSDVDSAFELAPYLWAGMGMFAAVVVILAISIFVKSLRGGSADGRSARVRQGEGQWFARVRPLDRGMFAAAPWGCLDVVGGRATFTRDREARPDWTITIPEARVSRDARGGRFRLAHPEVGEVVLTASRSALARWDDDSDVEVRRTTDEVLKILQGWGAQPL